MAWMPASTWERYDVTNGDVEAAQCDGEDGGAMTCIRCDA